MYRVNYQFDKHNVSILMLCMKVGDSWKQINDSHLETKINDKIKHVADSYEAEKGGFGEMHLTEGLTFITGTIDLVK